MKNTYSRFCRQVEDSLVESRRNEVDAEKPEQQIQSDIENLKLRGKFMLNQKC